MQAEIRVYRKLPGSGNVGYDFETGTYTGSQTLTVWTGSARIQPFGIIGDQIVAQDPTGRRLMRIQIKELNTGILVDDEVQVMVCEDNPDLVNYRMEIRGAVSSSNAWHTDLVAEANVKKFNGKG